MRKIIFLCGVVGGLLFMTASIMGGLQIEGYSFIGQYISESFSSGLPNTGYLRLMYITSGFLLVVFGASAPSFLPKSKAIKSGFFIFAFFYGVGNVIVSVFPCDFGCPTDVDTSSLAQLIHNISAFFTYIVVPFCFLGLGFSFKKFHSTATLSKISFISGVGSLIFVLLLFQDSNGPYIGLYQRIIESSILIWILFCSFHILKTSEK